MTKPANMGAIYTCTYSKTILKNNQGRINTLICDWGRQTMF